MLRTHTEVKFRRVAKLTEPAHYRASRFSRERFFPKHSVA